MSVDLASVAEDKGIRYFLISFVDLFGVLRSKLVPARAIAEMQRDGAGFAGFAAWLDMTPADPDMFAIPDPDSLVQLPWNREVGWLASDLWMNGAPVEASPRVVLKRQIERAEAAGYSMKTGVECEYFLLAPDEVAVSDPRDTQEKPCYDQTALMRRFDVIGEICDAMIELGWKPYQNDHEDANGQFEMNWEYDHCLVTADRHAFSSSWSRRSPSGTATARPSCPSRSPTSPETAATPMCRCGTGAGNNLFLDEDEEMGLSALAYSFLGGIVHSADAMCALFNPTVNSYKRIDATVTLSGATWSPSAISYSGNNRTHMIRIPDAGRFELRLMDGAANPYLAQAGVLAAGLDGIENERDPGKRLDINMYTEGDRLRRIRRLPLNLLDALRLFDRNKVARAAFGDAFVDSYVKLKLDEWRSYATTLSQWEFDHTLDA